MNEEVRFEFIEKIKYLDRIFMPIYFNLMFFCSKHKDIPKWCMYSDYSFDKVNKTYTFVLIPAERYLIPLSRTIGSKIKKDIKHTRTINEDKIKIFNSNMVFSVSFILDNEKELIASISKNQIETYLEELLTNLQNPEKKKIIILREEMKKKNFNITLLDRIFYLAFFAAYMEYKFTVVFGKLLDAFGWFSDRDNMTTAFDGVYSIFYNVHRNNLFYYLHYEWETRNVLKNLMVLGKHTAGLPAPQLFKDKNLFYDNYNRIADYICATIADFDFKENKVSKDKFITMIEHVLTNPNHNLLKVSKDKCRVISFHYSENRKKYADKIQKINNKIKVIEQRENNDILYNKRLEILKYYLTQYKKKYDSCVE